VVSAAPCTSLGELTTLPREGFTAPPEEFLPHSQPLALNFGPLGLTIDKFLAMPMASISNQNCCKGFHFKEKVEKHCFTARMSP